MKTSDIEKGTKVVTPSGTTGKVTQVRTNLTGKKGRPATLFVVNGEEFRAKDLRPAA